MSGPVYDFTCTTCDFSSSYASGKGAVVYQVPDGSVVHVPWDTAWCSHCQTIQRSQQGLSSCEIEGEVGRLESSLPRRRSRIVRLSRGADAYEDRAREELRTKRQLLAILRGRNSLNACMVCGCADVQPMDWGLANDTPRILPYSHPGCSGQLMVSQVMIIAWQRRPPDVLTPIFAEHP